MEWVPPRLAPHAEPAWAAGLPKLHRAAATLLETSFWLERSWPVPTKKDSIPRSRIVTLPCGHIALCRQEAPVPCFYRESAFPGLSAPSCTLAWLSKRKKPVLPHKIDLGQDLDHIKSKTNRMSSHSDLNNWVCFCLLGFSQDL